MKTGFLLHMKTKTKPEELQHYQGLVTDVK